MSAKLGTVTMIDFKQDLKADQIKALTNQVIGGQSLMYRVFREGLKCEDSEISKIELTYFSASVMTVVYLSLSNRRDTKQILDAFTQNIIRQSLPSSKAQLTFSDAVIQYRRRYQEYASLLGLFFEPNKTSSANPEITLLMHFFEKTTSTQARGHMSQIVAASGLIHQYVMDHVCFMKEKF